MKDAMLGRVLGLRDAKFALVFTLATVVAAWDIGATQRPQPSFDFSQHSYGVYAVPDPRIDETATIKRTPASDSVIPLPLAVTLRSISPVSASSKAVVSIGVRNNGDRSFRLPTYTDHRLLHWKLNEDRRMFSCPVLLQSDDWPGKEYRIEALRTYSASDHPDMERTVFNLMPGREAELRFEVDFGAGWGSDTRIWKDSIGKGGVTARVACLQDVLMPDLTVQTTARTYVSTNSTKTALSGALPLTLQP